MNKSQWSPKEIRKTALFILGIIIIVLGVILIFKDVKTEGTIKLDMNILKGEIKSGSAGLLLIFFAFFFIILSMINLPGQKTKEVSSIINKKISASTKILLVAIGMFLSAIILAAIDLIWLKTNVFVTIGVFLLILSFTVFILYIAIVNEE